MNVLGWKTEEFDEWYASTKKIVGYVFTIDGKSLKFPDYIPLSGCDIAEADYLSNTQVIEDAPYLACCSCGYVECDAVHAIVKLEGEKVSWTVFKHNYFGQDTPKIEDSYCFDKTQYSQAIHSLLEDIKNKNNEGH